MRVTSRDRSLQIMPPICLHIDLASFQTLFKAESQFSKAKWGNSIFAWVYLGQIIFCILCSLERAKFPLPLQFFFFVQDCTHGDCNKKMGSLELKMSKQSAHNYHKVDFVTCIRKQCARKKQPSNGALGILQEFSHDYAWLLQAMCAKNVRKCAKNWHNWAISFQRQRSEAELKSQQMQIQSKENWFSNEIFLA